jgi:hypothetical protein
MMTDRARRRLRNEILTVVAVAIIVSAVTWMLASFLA